MTKISVTVGLSCKVSNPKNEFENATFTRSFTQDEILAARPEDDDPAIQKAYDDFVVAKRKEIESRLREEAETSIQREVIEFKLGGEQTDG